MVHGNTGLVLIQDQDCPRFRSRRSGSATFGQGVYSNNRPSGLGETFRIIGKQVRDMAYFFALRQQDRPCFVPGPCVKTIPPENPGASPRTLVLPAGPKPTTTWAVLRRHCHSHAAKPK